MQNIFKKAAVLCAAALISSVAVAQDIPIATEIEIVNVTQRKLSKVEKTSRNSAVKIVHEHGHGSGTYIQIGREHGVITALHVVQGLDFVFVRASENELVPAAVVYRHENLDIAVLRIPRLKTRKAAKYKPTPASSQLGAQGVYTGYPSDYNLITVRGVVSGFLPETGNIIMQSFGWFGVSGSGIFDEQGRMIGVVSGISMEMGPFGPELLETMIHVAPTSTISEKTIEEALNAS